MLTCYEHHARLPQNSLVYLAFRLALKETLAETELYSSLEEEPSPPTGYLAEVPFLEQVHLPVQVDLLANAWARHRKPDLIEASLLDVAVVYAACETAGRVINDMPDVASAWIEGGPRKVRAGILKRMSRRLDAMFDRFWDDRDFLLIQDFQDLPPDRARQLKDSLRLPDEAMEPMYEALGRWYVSPDVTANLEGLLTGDEIQDALPFLRADVRRSRREGLVSQVVPSRLLTGIEDLYHGLFIGPCDPQAAEAETDCPLVEVIGVADEADFDGTFAEWVEQLRADVRQAAQQNTSCEPLPAEQSSEDASLNKQVEQARTAGLEDGARIESRGEGWVVVDSFSSFLVDPDDAAWVIGDDVEEMPPTVFPTTVAAYRAWQRSNEVAKARECRREAALKRLGR